jgi:hypothetical protein
MGLSRTSILGSFDQRLSGTTVRFVAAGIGLLAAFYYLFSTGPFQFPFDDSYITLEFARNFAATGGFTFDRVHAAPGATSPLHVVLLALASRLGFGLEAADAALGILFFLLIIERTGALAWRLTRSRQVVLFAATVTAVSGYLVYDSLNGLETTLFVFLALAWVTSIVGFIETRKVTIGMILWLFLALLTRPEAAWLAASLGVYLLFRAVRVSVERKALRRVLTFLAATGAAAILAQWALTGSAFPHTALAKVYLFGDLHKPLGERFTIFWQGWREVWSPLYFFLLLGIVARRARVILWMLLPWLLMTETLFCLLLPGQVATYWGRYQHPLIPFAFVLAGDGFEAVSRWLAKYRVGKMAQVLMLGLVAMLCVINFREFRQNLKDDKQVILANHFWAVKWLRENAPADARIATHDIGILRYEGGYNLEDLSGLISHEAFERNRAGQGQFEYLAGLRPDYVIGIDFWLEGYLRYFPQLTTNCRQVAHANPSTPTPIRLTIFQCNWEGTGVAPAPDAADSSRR